MQIRLYRIRRAGTGTSKFFQIPSEHILRPGKYLKIIPICFLFPKKGKPIVPPQGWLKIHFNNKMSLRKSDPDSDLVVNVLDPDPEKKVRIRPNPKTGQYTIERKLNHVVCQEIKLDRGRQQSQHRSKVSSNSRVQTHTAGLSRA
jgi:hypothetical protein